MIVHNPAQNIHFKLQDIKIKQANFSKPNVARVNVQCIISCMSTCKYLAENSHLVIYLLQEFSFLHLVMFCK